MTPKTNEEIAEGVAMRLDGRTVTSHEHFREMVKEEVLSALTSHTTYLKERVEEAREEERERTIDLLIEEGYLKGRELIPHDERKKSHGTCCYCSTCGHGNDDCVCEHNRLLQTIIARYQSELDQPNK